MTTHPVETWHRIVEERNAEGLEEWIAEDAVFYSPVVYKPQQGKPLTILYLASAMQVFGAGDFHYMREIIGQNDAVLEFEVNLDGTYINGVDMLRWNDAGQLTEFKVMLRPLKAIQLVQQRMAELMDKMFGMS